MEHSRIKQSVVRGVVAAGIVVGGIVVAMPVAPAGGWAVSTMDEVPAPVAGESTEVGFTIRQHGIRPINPDGEVGVNIESASGADTFFEATPQGATGHYTAAIRFAEPGSYRWEIHQGWFAPQDLGQIRVAEAGAAGAAAGAGTEGTSTSASSGSPGSEYRWPLPVRVLLPAVGIAFGALGITEMVRTRRRRAQGLITT